MALLGWLEDLEGAHEAVVDAHHRARIVELAAIVGCREDGDQLPLGKELVAVLDDLVRAADEVEVVLVEEARDHVGAKSVRDAAVVLAPARARPCPGQTREGRRAAPGRARPSAA